MTETLPEPYLPPPALVLDPPSLKALVDAVDEIKRAVMVDGIDYGPPYPGAKKPMLLKSGAEKLMLAFGLTAEDERGETVMRPPRKDAEGRELPATREGIYYRVTVSKDGRVLQACERYCGRDEPKARNWPWDTVCAMAAKRAMVAAVRRATNASEVFDEESPAVETEWDAPGPAHD